MNIKQKKLADEIVKFAEDKLKASSFDDDEKFTIFEDLTERFSALAEETAGEPDDSEDDDEDEDGEDDEDEDEEEKTE